MPAPSTTDLLQIKDISNGVIVLKDGGIRGVVQIDAINFELRSTDEQSAITQQFQGFLNSFDFPIQVVIQSRKYNVETYLAGVEASAAALTNELLKLQAQEYIRFVRELSQLANIMSKNFYVTVSLSVIPTKASGGGLLSGITGIFKKKTPAPAANPAAPAPELATYQIQLQQRADLIVGGLSGMGLKGKLLGQDELVALFSELYNPTINTPVTTQPTP